MPRMRRACLRCPVSLIARLQRGYSGWLVGTILGINFGPLSGETSPGLARIGWAVAMVGLFLAVCAISAVLARLLCVVLVRRMRRHTGISERRSFGLQLLESLRSSTVVGVLKAPGPAALVATMLTLAEFNLSQMAVLVPVITLLAALSITIIVLELWLEPELHNSLPNLRRRGDR